MRYYEQRYPEVDELVMVQVRQIAEMGAYVKLLEYDGVEGMILLSELSRRRIRSIQKLIRVGRNEVVVVLRVDKEKGYIDLSKRRVSPEDITKCEERYTKSKAVASILRNVASKLPSSESSTPIPPPKVEEPPKDATEDAETVGAVMEGGGEQSKEDERLEMLYDTVAWPLSKTYGHPYDAFKLALTEPETVFSVLDPRPPQPVLDALLAMIARRLTPQPIKLRADIELTCYTKAGIDAIKHALKAGEAVSTETVPIHAKLIAPPLYVLDTNASDKFAAVEKLERAIDLIQRTIEEAGGNLVIKMKPKAVSDTEEQDLAQLMAKAERENAEVSGDDDDEDQVGL